MSRTIVTALILGALALGGCSAQPRAERWTAMTARAHRDADRHLDAGDTAGARARLLALIDAQKTHAAVGPERLAIQDTYFRLARLALGDHDPRQALAYADAGLYYGTEPHLFVANLLVVRAAALEAVGDPRAAAAEYHRALFINETLLWQATARP